MGCPSGFPYGQRAMVSWVSRREVANLYIGIAAAGTGARVGTGAATGTCSPVGTAACAVDIFGISIVISRTADTLTGRLLHGDQDCGILEVRGVALALEFHENKCLRGGDKDFPVLHAVPEERLETAGRSVNRRCRVALASFEDFHTSE